MAYVRFRNYWLSDDFEKFYRLISSSQTVIFTNDNLKGRFESGGSRYFGTEKWGMKQKFLKRHTLFLDPDCTFNPEMQMLAGYEPDGLWEYAVYEKDTLHAIGDVFKRRAESSGRTVDICARIVDNWNFDINPSL